MFPQNIRSAVVNRWHLLVEKAQEDRGAANKIKTASSTNSPLEVCETYNSDKLICSKILKFNFVIF